MSICLSHTTAQEFWLRAMTRAPETDSRAFEFCTGDVRAASVDLERIRSTFPNAEEEMLHLLVPRADIRSNTPGVAFHVHSNPPIPGIINRLRPQVLIVSPEYSFLQMAKRSSLVPSALYGSYLCGSFRLPGTTTSLELPNRAPLTNRARIASFAQIAHGVYGVRPASQAIPWIIEGAASPREAQMVMRLCLPFRYGGYGIPLPRMNEIIDLDADEQKAVGKAFLKGDAVWPQARLVLEYDGYYHADKAQMEADAIRRATLRHAGWTVLEVTNQQLVSITAFDQIAQLVAKQVGRRLRSSQLGATPARRELVDDLYSPSNLPRW